MQDKTASNCAGRDTIIFQIRAFVNAQPEGEQFTVHDILSSTQVQSLLTELDLPWEAVFLAVHKLLEEGYLDGTDPYDIDNPHNAIVSLRT